ncbi:peptidylprolyl isomerase [Streptococcus danieliae]|uniref:Peptidyl-prolyl cis-trans isomerase n=1 Tax=Streptococcus danieliae TaxID=747656 RepID=A0A7Z0RR54_9STRE|nr:peptidylprolyl isomerase [Streptococcus danieliae]MBF0717397.1 peptidylprolyl isomerase [Streptococcus danieliae]NYS49327.1 peptidylprolyl isomerase [Streptococcus danieliae]
MKKLLIAALLASAATLALIIYQNQPKQELSLSAQLQEVLKNPETDFPQLTTKASKQEPVVTLKTSQGDISLKLFPEYAPLAVENFLTHAKEGYYNGLSFHRVIKDFMIQTGDPKGDGSGGESIWAGKDDEKDPGTGFKNEISPYLYNIRGAVSIANAGPDTNGSQFFINQNTQDISSRLDPNTYHPKIIQAYQKGGNPSLDGSYTVFGQVTQGMEVVDKIAATETDDKDKPKEAITIQKITIQSE